MAINGQHDYGLFAIIEIILMYVRWHDDWKQAALTVWDKLVDESPLIDEHSTEKRLRTLVIYATDDFKSLLFKSSRAFILY